MASFASCCFSCPSSVLLSFNLPAALSLSLLWLPFHLSLFVPKTFLLLLTKDRSIWILVSILLTDQWFMAYLFSEICPFSEFLEWCSHFITSLQCLFLNVLFFCSLSFSKVLYFSVFFHKFCFSPDYCPTFWHSRVGADEVHYDLQHPLLPGFFLLLFPPTLWGLSF